MELLRDMAFFVEVARAGRFTKAAHRLGVPTSTLSRRIEALERTDVLACSLEYGSLVLIGHFRVQAK
jgi:DNA-binding IclR family transcriptional regulator